MSCGQCKPHCRFVVEYVGLQVVVEAAQVVVVGDEEHLGPPPCTLDVGGYEAQDVLVPENEDDDKMITIRMRMMIMVTK